MPAAPSSFPRTPPPWQKPQGTLAPPMGGTLATAALDSAVFGADGPPSATPTPPAPLQPPWQSSQLPPPPQAAMTQPQPQYSWESGPGRPGPSVLPPPQPLQQEQQLRPP